MSMTWKYISNNKDGLIDIIYCSAVKMSIPINYFFTVLLKNGTEYDLTDTTLISILKNPIDFNAILDARDNYLKLQYK